MSFLGREKIIKRIPEIYDLCIKYLGIDISKESIPVVPSVHFFMGGIAVKNDHETNIKGLYAVGECASIYHGANRLGGNSLLAACHSGRVAAGAIAGREETGVDAAPDFEEELKAIEKELARNDQSRSLFPVKYIRDMLAKNMNNDLGIVRSEEALAKGIEDIEYYLGIVDKIRFDSSESPYYTYSLKPILILARATLTCALERRETRGAHIRSDYPDTSEELASATIISYDNGDYKVTYDREGRYED